MRCKWPLMKPTLGEINLAFDVGQGVISPTQDKFHNYLQKQILIFQDLNVKPLVHFPTLYIKPSPTKFQTLIFIMAQLQCDVTIIRLANLDSNLPQGNLFVRYYVFVGGGRRIRIDTRSVPCTNEPIWDERASLECRGNTNVVNEVIGGSSVVFELRWRRRSSSVLGKMVRSKLLGRAEVAWREAMDSTDMLVEKWVGLELGSKPIPLLVKMGIGFKVSDAMEKKTMLGRQRIWKECNCESCGWVGTEEDMFLCANAASMID